MKWFKHMSDSLSDPFIFELIENFGGDGYLVFFGTLSLMAAEFDINFPGKSQFSVKFLAKNFQISDKKLRKIFNFITKKGKFFVEYCNGMYFINCPKFKDICDNFTRKSLSKSTK